MNLSDFPCAELDGAHKSFGKTVALDGLDLDVQAGELLALLGPNGAGKTTAISLLLGLLQPDRGSVRLFGHDPRGPRALDARRSIGVMMQEAALAPELKVRELVELAASYYPEPLEVDTVLALTHTASLAARPYGRLSGGQKRQIQFALALCGRPRLLFLDEPTVGLDLEARERMWDGLRQLVSLGTAIVLTTHYLEEAEALADRVAVLVQGKLVAHGTLPEIRAHVTRKRIVCATRLPLEEIERWDGVESVRSDRGRLQVTAPEAEAIVRRLLAEDPQLAGLEVHRAGLAEAFTALTSQEAA